ncbi:hypothetical protein AX14_012147 [Amanita brunnescens Koide BX004]|nr:hypothetical protein AX14_012147 [Amanita brunnescens Koide BX004]
MGLGKVFTAQSQPRPRPRTKLRRSKHRHRSLLNRRRLRNPNPKLRKSGAKYTVEESAEDDEGRGGRTYYEDIPHRSDDIRNDNQGSRGTGILSVRLHRR